uniref:RING-type domain-containing protein n=1 Tax=Denticeps clupeoides TaxID=299321 RepID=A0AAY4BPM5_9TELE
MLIPTGSQAGREHEEAFIAIPIISCLPQNQHRLNERELQHLPRRNVDPARGSEVEDDDVIFISSTLARQDVENAVRNSRQSDCRICLCEYTAGEELRVLPCLHDFHAECVGRWLQQSPSCPICRADTKPDRRDQPEVCTHTHTHTHINAPQHTVTV